MKLDADGQSLDASVSQSGYDGKFDESDTCSNVASVTPANVGNGKTSYKIRAEGNGSCVATFTGGASRHAALRIAVAIDGGVKTDPQSLLFTQVDQTREVAVTQSNYGGAFTVTDTCANIARVTPENDGVFAVTAIGAGSCGATFTGGESKHATVPISVVPAPGAVVLSPSRVTLQAAGAANGRSVNVTQKNYAGAFDETDACSGVARVKGTTNAGGGASFLVSAIATGSCDATFAGGASQSATLPISIELPGAVVLAPATLSFATTGTSSAKTVKISQRNWDGTFDERDTCANIASVTAASNTGGKAAFMVTPSGAGSCRAIFTGGAAVHATLPVFVAAPGPLSVAVLCAQSADACSNGSETTAGSQTFTLQSDTCNRSDDPSAGGNWATFAPAAGSSAASFVVTAQKAGTTGNPSKCTAVVVDGTGQAVTIDVEVTLSGIGVHLRH